MAFRRRRRAANNQIEFELRPGADEVYVSIRSPGSEAKQLQLTDVPLKTAIITATRLAHRSACDVAVIDRYGLWPE